MVPRIKVVRQEQMPIKAHSGDAGFDVFSDDNHLLWPGMSKKIPLGFCIELPRDWFAMISERSGMAAKQSLFTIGNIIDCTYRGEVHAIIHNGDPNNRHQINKGDKIAQMLIIPCYTSTILEVVDELTDTPRGDSGFGSTGK